MKKLLTWKTNWHILYFLEEFRKTAWFFGMLAIVMSSIYGIVNQSIFTHVLPIGIFLFSVLLMLDTKTIKYVVKQPILQSALKTSWNNITRILCEEKFKKNILAKMNNEPYQTYTIYISKKTDLIIKYCKETNHIQYALFDKIEKKNVFSLSEKEINNKKFDFFLEYNAKSIQNIKHFPKIEKKLLEIYKSNDKLEAFGKNKKHFNSLKDHAQSLYSKTKENEFFKEINNLCATYLDLKDLYSLNPSFKNYNDIEWLEKNIESTLINFEKIMNIQNKTVKNNSLEALKKTANDLNERLERTLNKEISNINKNDKNLNSQIFEKLEQKEQIYEYNK